MVAEMSKIYIMIENVFLSVRRPFFNAGEGKNWEEIIIENIYRDKHYLELASQYNGRGIFKKSPLNFTCVLSILLSISSPTCS